MAAPNTQLAVKIEFSGGLELLFDNKKKHNVTLPSAVDGKPVDVTYLLSWLRDNLLKERPELFMEEKTVYACSIFLFPRWLRRSLDGLEFSCSSTTATGNSREKATTSSRTMTISSLFQPCMVASSI